MAALARATLGVLTPTQPPRETTLQHFNSVMAAQLIKAALESNSIKLAAAAGTLEYSKDAAERDALYLLTLFNKLTGSTQAD